jgi:hypothetical protein
MIAAAELKMEAAPQSAYDAMQGLTNNQPVSEVRPMAGTILNPRTCRECGCSDQSKFPSWSRRRLCYPCLARIQREYRKKRNPDYWTSKDKKYGLKKRYGISVETFTEMIVAQNYRCAICGLDPRTMAHWPHHHQVLHVDHDHATGVVRGLLCNHCNRAVGFLRDDASIAQRVLDYIVTHSAKEPA